MTIRANLSWKAIIGLGAWLLLGLGLSMSVAPGSLAATRQEAASKTEPASDPAAGAGSREASLGIQATSRTRDAYEIFIIQYWALGPLLRAEAVVRGQNVITVVNREFYSAWNALTNSGYRIKRPPEAIAADARRSRPFALQLLSLIHI